MSLLSKLETAVEKAFSVFSDFVYDGFLVPKPESGYNWSENRLKGSREQKRPIQVIFYEDSRKTSDNSTVTYQAIVRSKDFDKSLYDQIEIQKQLYNVSSFKDYGVIAELTLVTTGR
jgi:hypothetical protein